MTTAAAPHTFVPDYAHDPSLCGYEFINRNFCGQPRSAPIHRLVSDAPAVTTDEAAKRWFSARAQAEGIKSALKQIDASEPQAVPPERIWLCRVGSGWGKRWLIPNVNVQDNESYASYTRTSTAEQFTSRMRHQDITPERWEELQAALDRDGGPTEAEAEEVLRYFGTSGKEVVNQFIERLMRENLEARTAASALAEALREVMNNNELEHSYDCHTEELENTDAMALEEFEAHCNCYIATAREALARWEGKGESDE